METLRSCAFALAIMAPLAGHAVTFNTVATTIGNDTLSAQNVAGHMFTVLDGATVSISDVGVFDAGGDGTTGAASIYLFKAINGPIDPFAGNTYDTMPAAYTVGSWTVPAGPSSGGYTYTPTGGVDIGAGTYMLLVTSMSDADLIGDAEGTGLDLPSFSASGLAFNSDIANYAVGVRQRYKVANFIYTAVPEPGVSVAAAAAGLVAFAAWRRRA